MKKEDLSDDDFGGDLEGLEDDDIVDDAIVEAIEASMLAPDLPLYHLRLACSSETFYAIYRGELLPPKSQVLVPTRYGRDLAVIIRQIKRDTNKRKIARITQIERPATDDDLERARNNVPLEEKAFLICRDMIKEHHLPEMKLLSAHHLLEDPKIVFFYTAPKRIDFRFLLKDLVSYFKTRIELRQIGFRDDARINGGLGVCGREFCCRGVFNRTKTISIRMAKDQKLSLNPLKISGHCEKLLCCLAYEHDFYQEQLKLMPQEGARVSYSGALWRVSEINAVLGMVTLAAEDGRKVFLPKTQFEKADNRWHAKAAPKKEKTEGAS
ncbi:MAG: hypothetical protein LBC72_01020 [Spirochaetaceae bacterium]|jgi:cell fate regulator YaaT (PSP1 superfamily)|nr:hypothetical protein [Spirochaetaceae bacterium]